MPTLRLRPVRSDDEAQVLTAQRIMQSEDFPFALELTDGDDFAAYVGRLHEMRCGVGLAPGRVPAALLVAELDGTIVGRTSIRFELTDWLLAYGGHIGYAVLPGYRRRGLATEILRQSLVIARSHGVADALLVCDDNNVGSARVIELCGGVLDPVWPHTSEASPQRRYWIM